MSIVLHVRARETNLKPAAKAVLKELCFIADDLGGSIYPSISTLARWTSLSERSVRYALDELDLLHYISRPAQEQRRGGKQTVQYRVNVEALPTLRTPAPNAPLQGVQPPLQQVQPTPAKRAVTPAAGAANKPDRPERPERPAALNNGNGNGIDYSGVTTDRLRTMQEQCRIRKEPCPNIDRELARRAHA